MKKKIEKKLEIDEKILKSLKYKGDLALCGKKTCIQFTGENKLGKIYTIK